LGVSEEVTVHMSAGETRQLHWFKLADLIRQKIENGGRRKDKVTVGAPLRLKAFNSPEDLSPSYC
jgi:hypothetical protein